MTGTSLLGTLVARGDVELGFQQLSELMHLPGIDVIGPLPPQIQVATVFSKKINDGRKNYLVVPAKAGTQWCSQFRQRHWVPAFAGTTTPFCHSLIEKFSRTTSSGYCAAKH